MPGVDPWVWLCASILDEENTCQALTSSGSDRWDEFDGDTGSGTMFAIYNNANTATGDAVLKDGFKDQFSKTITAMFGGRNKWNGFAIHGDEWNCGATTTNQVW